MSKAKEMARRLREPDRNVRLAGCPSYKTRNGHWQADMDLSHCYRMAQSEGTYLVRHGMKPEDYYACADWEWPHGEYIVELED